MSKCDCEVTVKNKEESTILIILLGVNALMFLIEITLGIFSESTALIADSLDMLADAAVYGVALYAVGQPALAKIKAAQISGLLQIILGTAVAIDVIRRLIFGSAPESLIMIPVGVAALIANLVCLQLISAHRNGEVHMRASWIFSKNDVIANVAIIMGGLLVYLLNSRYPDIVIGLAISSLVIHGGVHILKDAHHEKKIQWANNA
ncbi:MAG TPA: cation transporter [Betaproteobacteria bacterium]|nr:cation transporter [Betaproteobacteria bacterium]